MRREVIAMGSIAASAGIALAVLLTHAFGAQSSGPPAALKPASGPAAAETHVPAKVRRRVEHPRRHAHRRHAPAVGASPRTPPASAVADTPAPVTTPTRTTAPTQTVAAPAPAPQPVRPLSHPKPSKPAGGAPGGVSFDDSG
jgi:hypothetical protein